ncbi:VCBS repeat-containing protein [Fonticella tunisiensis]|uniref:Uncharacterized protein n=1 Tax=Fonticella tunisiensis TaxID=1096341 RepID=A0A4R7KQH6_9CLOT|nr:VCBS repeat-containing protein [Fonticella tunisiensis]TDT61315.1 hypothetical protein EDD71_10740 [Fonticella tunisiensis]
MHYPFHNLRQMMYFNGRGYYILDFKQGDINGDGIIEDVYIVGDKPYGEESAFSNNIAIALYDTKTNAYIKIPLNINAGYRPTLFLGDFTGDKVDDILISIDSGGSGGFTFNYVFSFLNNRWEKLFDFEKFNEEYKYNVIYRDYYKVDIVSKNLNKKYTIDISCHERKNLAESYNENGRLKAPFVGWVLSIGGLYPIDIQRDEVYELIAVQRVIGRSNADTLGFVETYLRWNKGEFAPFNQFVAVLGSKIHFK